MLTADRYKINLGEMISGQSKKMSIVIYNDSLEAQSVTLWWGCGCTTPLINLNPIPAKESAILTATFDSIGKLGFQAKAFGIDYQYKGTSHRLTIEFTADVK